MGELDFIRDFFKENIVKLYLINPLNPVYNMVKSQDSRWSKYRAWQPLGLMIIAAATPLDWEIELLDENISRLDFHKLPKPDAVGLTTFTSQANRAYEIAKIYRDRGVPVIMGGIHATLCKDEALQYVDTVVSGEAEEIWPTVLEDVKTGRLKDVYDGCFTDMSKTPIPRHDLTSGKYWIGSIQTTRGCPLNCTFCSVTSFNGQKYRQRPIPDVIAELNQIPQKRVMIVDDNLIGTRKDHIERAKDLFRQMIKHKVNKHWYAQVTMNFGEDDELLSLARKAGCEGVFIGFETITKEGLLELKKKFNASKGCDYRDGVQRIHKHRILIAGSFIIGLDTDEKGIGRHIAESAVDMGVDILNALILTPLPGTQLWKSLEQENRLTATNFPEDWDYYNLNFPVAQYKNFTYEEIINEMMDCDRAFYMRKRCWYRILRAVVTSNNPLIQTVANLGYRAAVLNWRKQYSRFQRTHGLELAAITAPFTASDTVASVLPSSD
jgi:radical SAM superfamily enzyme YgiQ (UPF0313 family)